MREIEGGFNIGAGVTYERAESAMAAIDPDLVELFRRIGAKQVRTVGTLGGNIANGSPIGDTLPALIVLGATLHLRRGQATRSMPLEEFFIDYGKQDLAAGEFVTGIDVPRLKSNEVFRCYKISKRFDQDISALLGAFRFTVEAGRVTRARVAFGGMAATPKRAAASEAALKGLRLADQRGWDAACEALASDFQPIDDMRASARYRLETAQALLRKALHEAGGEASAATPARGPAARGDGACRLTFFNRTGPHPATPTARSGGRSPMTARFGTSRARRASSTTFPSRQRWSMSRPAMPRIPPAAGSPRSTSMRYGPRQASWRS